MSARIAPRVQLALLAAVFVAFVCIVVVTLGAGSAPAADPVGDKLVSVQHAAEVPGTMTDRGHCQHHVPDYHPGGGHCFADDHNFDRSLCQVYNTDDAHIC